MVSRELPLEPELIAESEPETEEPELVSEPEWESDVVVAAPSELPINFGERSKRLTPEFERPIVRRSQPVSPTLDDEIDEDDEVPQPARSVRDVVQLGFEDNDLAEDDADENMELVEVEEPTKSVNRLPRFVEPIPVLEIQTVDSEDPMQTVEPDDQPMRLEIQTIAAQEVPEKSQVTNAPHEIEPEVAPPSDEVLAELKPVRSIEIRKAIQIPALADMDNPQLREPPDQAQAYLRKLKRQPYKFWPVYRDPWVANRDSYAFHHNPLWFEDPNLERCGRGCGHVTSVSSFVQFSANIAILPYRMTAQPSCSCVRTLPDCTVCQKFGYDAYLPPWSWRAAAVQAGAVVGGIYVIP